MANTILGLRAETSIHAGSGQNVGVIDLPIQREAHTGWPCVYGSAVKGALRSHAETRANMGSDVKAIFGPSSSGNIDHAGALAVSDARILLLPVRSLTGYFKWVTCPAVLSRLQRDLALAGKPASFAVPTEPQPEQVMACENSDTLFLEEYQFTQVKAEGEALEQLQAIIEVLSQFGMEQAALQLQLVIMNNDDFSHFCGSATAITPHISIDNTNKTVKGGALWYEESLPPDTLLYTLLLANNTRNKTGNTYDAQQVLTKTLALFPDDRPYVQIGGNETVGMGWCKVTEYKP